TGQGLTQRERSLVANPGAEVASFDELHGQPGQSAPVQDLEDGNDVGVAELRGGPRLSEEALTHGGVGSEVGPGALQGDVADEAGIPRAEDDAHPPAADLAEDLVVGLAVPGLDGRLHRPGRRNRIPGWAPARSTLSHRASPFRLPSSRKWRGMLAQ